MSETAEGGGATEIDGVRVTRDAFLGGRLNLYQPATGYRAGIDAVLLAASLDGSDCAGQRIADLGAGVGTVGLCAAGRLKSARIDLIERVDSMVAIARRNVVENELGDRVRPVHCDLLGPAAQNLIPTEGYDQAVANPPFHAPGAMRQPTDPLKAASHAGRRDEIDGWCRCLVRILKPGGLATVIHVPDVLGDLLAACEGRFGALEIVPIYPRDGRSAIRILVRARKGSRAAPSLRPGVVLHGDGQAFRPEIARVLTAPNRLDIWS